MLRITAVLATLLVPSLALASGGGGLNWSDFMWRIITFAVFAFIMVKILKNPIVNGLAKRSEDIAQAIKDAEKAKEDAETEVTQYELKMKEMEKDLELMKERAMKAAEADKAAILEDAEKTVEKLEKFATKLIESETLKAKEVLRKETVKAAIQVVEERLGKELDAATQDKLMQNYMKRIGAQK